MGKIFRNTSVIKKAFDFWISLLRAEHKFRLSSVKVSEVFQNLQHSETIVEGNFDKHQDLQTACRIESGGGEKTRREAGKQMPGLLSFVI